MCADAAFKNLKEDSGSQRGVAVVLLAGATSPPPGSTGSVTARPNPEGDCHFLVYSSKRIRRVCRSTLSAELQASSSGIECALWVAGVYDEILGRSGRSK